VDQPLMRAVLADLALDCEGALALMMRVARAMDLAGADRGEALRARLLIPVAKYWICKIAPAFCYEAMECIGGNGYVEESVLARLYREAPVNAIWEGSGNVVCLDVLRALAREGEPARALLADLRREAAGLPGIDETADFIARCFSSSTAEADARAAVEGLARIAAAVALKQSAPDVAEMFSRARLSERHGAAYGSVVMESDLQTWLLERTLPVQ
jgi:putative acyl-CoA dehydrogenase